MAALTDLVNNVILSAEGVPEALAIQRYLDAARQFLRETQAWKTQATLAKYTGTDAYMIIPPTNAVAVDTVRVMYQGNDDPLEKITRDRMLYLYPPGAMQAGSRPKYHRLGNNIIYVAPDPGTNVASLLTAVVAFRPTRTADTMDDNVVDDFGEIFEYGALGRLLAMPGKPWTDTKASVYYLDQFLGSINEWKALGADDGQRGVVRTVRYGGL